MTRADWQQRAEERLLAAQELLAARYWPSAYYLAGYAVEFGLKSCILVRLGLTPEIIFESRDFSKNCWIHNIVSLTAQAGLTDILNADKAGNATLRGHWHLVEQWSESSRYNVKTELEALSLCTAICDNADGVMQWIRARW